MPGATNTQQSPSSSYEWPSLTSDQQRLLLQALNSNDRRLNMNEFNDYQNQSLDNSLTSSMGVDPHIFGLTSPLSETIRRSGRPTFGDGLMPDLSNGHTTDFDVELPKDLVDGLSGFENVESGEKRKSSEDDEDQEENDAKRRDSSDKGPKKPGRKPLMAEPTTKRKAQNRAAQRAFRERKEQHLKDLETKISDLTQVSQTANQENSVLRAQVVRLQEEVKIYKKRLSAGGGIGSRSSLDGDFNLFSDNLVNSNNPFDFAFQTSYTNFSQPNVSPTSSHRKSTSAHSPVNDNVNVKQEPTSRSNSTSWSPDTVLNGLPTPDSRSPSQADLFNRNGTSHTSNVFTPGLFETNNNNYGFPQFGSPSPMLAQQNGTSAANTNGLSYSSIGSRGSSGSISSHAASPSLSSWRNGTSSSCGTSPEPWHEANGDKINGAQNQTSNNALLGGLSEFQFDPSLFGGYRESQDAIFGDGDFTGGLYDDFLNMPTTNGSFETSHVGQPNAHTAVPTKTNLLDEVARRREGAVDEDIHIPEDSDKRQMMTCHKIWQQLRDCPKFQQGDLDIDGLCSELSKKATCSESGANIPKDEWEAALWRMVGQPDGAKEKPKERSTSQAQKASA